VAGKDKPGFKSGDLLSIRISKKELTDVQN
jgi:hypothetical protein